MNDCEIRTIHIGTTRDREFMSRMIAGAKLDDDRIRCMVVNPKNLVFEERVRLLCTACKRYGVNWTCPPKMNNIDFRKAIGEYQNGLVVFLDAKVQDPSQYEEVRSQSTNIVHRSLLNLEKSLWDLSYPMAISFIGGSCKLCKKGCAEDRCRTPHLARIPWEATGCNVMATLKQECKIEVVYRQDQISRYGLLLW